MAGNDYFANGPHLRPGNETTEFPLGAIYSQENLRIKFHLRHVATAAFRIRRQLDEFGSE